MAQTQGSHTLYLKRHIASLSLSFLICDRFVITPTFRDVTEIRRDDLGEAPGVVPAHGEGSAPVGSCSFSSLGCLLHTHTCLCLLSLPSPEPCIGCEQPATSHPHFRAAVVTLPSPPLQWVKHIPSQVLPPPKRAMKMPRMDLRFPSPL